MNTVNPENFNITMGGYVEHALSDMEATLRKYNYDEEQIEEIISMFNSSLSHSKSMMTMKDARDHYYK